MKTSKDGRGPGFNSDHSRKNKLLKSKLSTLLFLTTVTCEKMLVMALPLVLPSVHDVSFSVELAGKNSASGIKDTEGMDTIKSTGGLLQCPKALGMIDDLLVGSSQYRHHKLALFPIKNLSTNLKNVRSDTVEFDEVPNLGTLKSTKNDVGSKHILDRIGDPSPNLNNFDSYTSETKEVAKVEYGSDIGEKGHVPRSFTVKSELPGKRISPESIDRSRKPNPNISLTWIAKFKNWMKKMIGLFPNLFQRIKGKRKPSEDTLIASSQGFKPILVKTAAKPNWIIWAKLVLERYFKSWSDECKNAIKKRTEREAIRKQQNAVRLEATVRDWYRSLPPEAWRRPQPRKPSKAEEPHQTYQPQPKL